MTQDLGGYKMNIVIRSKTLQLVSARTRYNKEPFERYVYFYHNLKVDNWDDFIKYVKQYKNKGE